MRRSSIFSASEDIPNNDKSSRSKAEDKLSPDCGREKKTSTPSIQKEYSDNRLSVHTISSLKAVRHHYIVFVFMVCSVFFRLVYLRSKTNWIFHRL